MAAAAFFGIDLAWSDRNSSGVCALDGTGRVVDERTLHDDDGIVGWVESLLGGAAVVAVDAPLQVPNATGRRPCERELGARYGGRKAGPHPSNRTLLEGRMGRVRGEDLAARLEALGFAGPWQRGARTVMEVYPHPGLVEVFCLPQRLRYKKGKVAERRAGLAALAALLDRLRDADPPLLGPALPEIEALRGRALKALEDRLDARFCAWVASVWARHGTARVHLFGDPAGGHIAVPFGPLVPGGTA